MSDGSIFSQTIGNADVVIGAGDWTSIVSGNGRYVAIGDNTLAAKRFSAYSDNGTDWTYKEQKTVFTWSGNVVYGNGKFVTSGTDVFYSSNGNSWTKVDTEYAFSDIIFANNQFIAVGNDQIGTSTDGITWTVQEIETNGNCICIMQ